MIDPEEWLDMKSRYQNDMSNSEVSRRTGHDMKTVRKYVHGDSDLPRYKTRKSIPSKLDPFKGYVKARIEENDLSSVRFLPGGGANPCAGSGR